MTIFVSGTIAYDIILDYPGRFAEHINPAKARVMSLSFLVKNVKRSLGGTAGNIGYNLAMLGLTVELLAAVGKDGKEIIERYKSRSIGLELLKISNKPTATAYIMTDSADNQIAGFYPGAMMERSALPELEPCDWPIIAAENPANMARLANHYQKTRHRYIFDPGQATTALDKQQILTCLKGASVLIGNDYEIDYTLRKVGRGKVSGVVIRTLGHKGSEIVFPNSKKVRVGIVKTNKAVDPTGAGDAYRAGLVKGIVSGLDLKRAAQLGATAAVFAAEKYGTQNHRFNYAILVKRHNRNFKDKI